MKELIEALQIFLKYANEDYPTHCEHDTLHVVGIELEDVSKEDVEKLDTLGFRWSYEYDNFVSTKYGSA